MVAAGILAFLANLAVLRSYDESVQVAVASTDLDAGIQIDPASHIRYVDIRGDSEVLDGLVSSGEVASKAAGRIVASTVRSGEMLLESELVRAATGTGLRLFSIPIRPEKAVGGDVSVGDRIDVITVDDGGAGYVVSGIEVVGVPAEQRGAFAASSSFYVTVAVDDEQVLELAEAAENSEVMIVRSTGAPPPRSNRDHAGSDGSETELP